MGVNDLQNLINKKRSQCLIGLIFIVAGLGHFVFPDFYVHIMPPYIPFHLEVVYLTGVLEIIGGIAMVMRAYSKWVAYGLIVLLLAIFPSNIYMAMNPDVFTETPIWGLYLRLPLQFVLIGWVYWSVYDGHSTQGDEAG